MAGIRCGMAIGRPDLLEKLETYNSGSAMPITAVAAATASLKHEPLVSELKQLNTAIRQKTFDFPPSKRDAFLPPPPNFFLVSTQPPPHKTISPMPNPT